MSDRRARVGFNAHGTRRLAYPAASACEALVPARKFLEHNDKVQVTVLFRGREMQHQQEGRRVLDLVLEQLADVGKVERQPSMDGRKMTALLMPAKATAKPKAKAEPRPVAPEPTA